ncbi:MAG: SGNH/GDSL hydrolase family protein [Clostridia bacterium]|nr:SGNH/GDSL hydrolase family protein [Clostridia bacterium]
MKKLLFLCIFLLLCLVACTAEPPIAETTGTTAATTTTTPTATAVTTTPVTTAPVDTPMLFGIPLSEYTIVTDSKTRTDGEYLFSHLYKNYGLILPVEHKTESPYVIRLEADDDLSLDTCRISRDGTILTAGAYGVNGTYLAALTLCKLFDNAYAESPKDLTFEKAFYKSTADYLSAHTTELFMSDGTLNEYYEGDLNLAFIGGSLTQGKSAWMEPVANLFRAWYPDATVNCLDAGIGATNSELGAARLERNVFENMTPDILFIDFSVNDGGLVTETDATVLKNGVYMESIIKQCRALEDPPIIIFLHFPVGQRIGSTYHTNWSRGVALKDCLAEHYGIGTVNVWDFFEDLYEETLLKEPSLTYEDFLMRYYAPTDMTHPMNEGFSVFADAITSALRADPAKYLINKLRAGTYFEKFEAIGERTYIFRTIDDEEYFTVEGNFTHYTATAFATDDPRFVPGRMSAMQLKDGIFQCDDGEGFSIAFDTMASAIKLYGANAPYGVDVAVYSDGEKIGTVSIKANNTYLHFLNIEIPEGGDRLHRIELRPENITDEAFVFRIGYIVECME